MTKEVEGSFVVTEATLHFLLNGSQPMIRWDEGFGILAAVMSGGNMTAQFIGGARISIIPSKAGLIYSLDNTTDQNSHHAHIGDSTPRSPNSARPESTIYQRFTWVVPH
ncbi:MAG: hypothetical protein ACXVAY_21800 [Mucilaginibacter sp.]